MREPIRLAVVGHTNVGKTSLLRTLLRDRQFGEVSHRPSTTRHVEGARLSANGRALLELYDTPGMEDAIALLELLDRQASQAPRQDGPTRISRFLDSSEARQRFEQEAKVLRQLLSADAGLYVIDAREPVLAKYRDELAILALCGKPLLPVLNFSAVDTPRQLAWRQALARLGLHALVCFDSVTPPADGEQRLYQSLTLLLEKAREPLQVLLDDLRLQQQQRQQAGLRLIAELLLDCAALRRRAASQETERVLQQLQDSVRQREQRCVDALLQLYAFDSSDAQAEALPLLDGRWGDDLFNPETLRQLGIHLGSGMAAGAAAGVGVDLLVGGMTLGAAAALGALAGGGVQTVRNYGARLLGKLKGQRELSVDDSILRLLGLRQLQLLSALQRRGHAAQQPLQVQVEPAHWQQGKLPAALQQARAHPQWCSLDTPFNPAQPRRQAALQQLQAELSARHAG